MALSPNVSQSPKLTYKLIVVLVHGAQADTETLHDAVADVLAPLGLRLSAAKTRIPHLGEGFDVLGVHLQWRRKRGASTWHADTFW